MTLGPESRPSRHLPAQIAAVLGGTILVFSLTLALALITMARRLDREAAEGSVRLVLAAIAALPDRSRAFALDYALWDEAAQAAESGDRDWLWANLGSSTAIGVAGNLVVVWGGGLEGDLGWIDQSPASGLSHLLGRRVLAEAERTLAALPPEGQKGVGFFAWRGNDLFALGAARIERVLDDGMPALSGTPSPAYLLVGRRLSREALSAISESTGAGGLALTRQRPNEEEGDRLLAPLHGSDGAPVAWLSWDAPHPGSAMLRQMAPLVLGVGTLATALAALGLAVARRGARDLLHAEARARAAARIDPLTGLPNRAAFHEAIERPALPGERAVLYLDVNGFKDINDSLGHAAGDAVLRRLAARLRPLCEEGDLLARIGGDEFVFVLLGADAERRAIRLARRVESALGRPFELAGRSLPVSAAIGMAVQGDEGTGTDGDDLVRQADLAMYESKRQSRSAGAAPAVVPGRDLDPIERGLRRAIETGEGITLHYQPILRLSDGGLHRAEALARWWSEELGAVPPARFIPVAERAGLMGELGAHLLQILAGDLADHPALRVSVNLSACQIAAPGFAAGLVAVLARKGVGPDRVEAELTEAALGEDLRLAARRLGDLHEAGITLALDDFGAGRSSCRMLRELPFGTLKLDHALVAGCADTTEAALLGAMMGIGRALGLTVTCEGVETAETLDRVRAMGADFAQGWQIARPMPIRQLAALWLRGGQAAVA